MDISRVIKKHYWTKGTIHVSLTSGQRFESQDHM